MQASQTSSKEAWKKGQGSVYFCFLFSLEACPAPRKAVHSREKNHELSLFIVPVLVKNNYFYFIYLGDCPDFPSLLNGGNIACHESPETYEERQT